MLRHENIVNGRKWLTGHTLYHASSPLHCRNILRWLSQEFHNCLETSWLTARVYNNAYFSSRKIFRGAGVNHSHLWSSTSFLKFSKEMRHISSSSGPSLPRLNILWFGPSCCPATRCRPRDSREKILHNLKRSQLWKRSASGRRIQTLNSKISHRRLTERKLAVIEWFKIAIKLRRTQPSCDRIVELFASTNKLDIVKVKSSLKAIALATTDGRLETSCGKLKTMS